MPGCFVFGLDRNLADGASMPTADIERLTGGNTGNMAFHEAIFGSLAAEPPAVKWHEFASRPFDRSDIAIVPAANQIGAHADFGRSAQNWGAMGCSFVVIGLGAQSEIGFAMPDVPEGSRAWLRMLAERSPMGAPNIAVRGEFTLSVMRHLGLGDRATVLGCPSLFISPEPWLGRVIAANTRPFRRVAVAAGHPGWSDLSHLEASLARIVSETDGSYVGQSPLSMLQLCRGEARMMPEGELAACHAYAGAHLGREAFVAWSERHGRIFWNAQDWIAHYRSFDFVVGTRIHGVALALQAGVPELCLVHDSRTLELCQTMAIPHVAVAGLAAGTTLEQLRALYLFDADAFDENRRMLARRYVGFLVTNGLQPAEYLHRLAGG
jgi:hypothetical protein